MGNVISISRAATRAQNYRKSLGRGSILREWGRTACICREHLGGQEGEEPAWAIVPTHCLSSHLHSRATNHRAVAAKPLIHNPATEPFSSKDSPVDMTNTQPTRLRAEYEEREYTHTAQRRC